MSKLHEGPTAVVMVNLTNHPVAKWSPAQVSAALAIAPDGVTDLDGGMPVVPPAASTGDVIALATSIVCRAEGQAEDDVGDDVAVTTCLAVQGDPTFVYHVVKYADTCGIRAYVAVFDDAGAFVQWRSF